MWYIDYLVQLLLLVLGILFDTTQDEKVLHNLRERYQHELEQKIQIWFLVNLLSLVQKRLSPNVKLIILPVNEELLQQTQQLLIVLKIQLIMLHLRLQQFPELSVFIIVLMLLYQVLLLDQQYELVNLVINIIPQRLQQQLQDGQLNLHHLLQVLKRMLLNIYIYIHVRKLRLFHKLQIMVQHVPQVLFSWMILKPLLMVEK